MATIAQRSITIAAAKVHASSSLLDIRISGSGEGMLIGDDKGDLTIPLEALLTYLIRWARINNVTPAQAIGKVVTVTITVV